FDPLIFGQPLEVSLQHASAIVTSPYEKINFGPLPMVVAVSGTYLLENALQVQGIFRLNGSAKRIRELQQIFAEPPTFGSTITWQGYNVHDAANLLRRYLNNLPEPIVPLSEYDSFRAPFVALELSHPNSSSGKPAKFSSAQRREIVSEQQKLFMRLPPANRQLLLYLLDMLEMFAKHSKKNLMPVPNLASSFQPCILSHPSHDQSPEDYKISRACVIFLIENCKDF
ncbi:Rho GTPase activation protein, partial [Lipomyces oligophaga]|uniref:Rho GTPase activation protein n=1 Tax=Lipomyces oligophaga TaxID=45792 RepID=UPI0034CE6D72